MRISEHGHRLGRNPSLAKNIARRVQLADFFDHAALLPLLPAAFLPPSDYVAPMHLNDQLGDCGPAACAHAVEQNSLMSSGVEKTIADSQVQSFYFGITGGQDSGVDMEQMFGYWRKNPLGDEEILAYAALRPGDLDQLEAAQYIFEGAVIIGASLPDRVVPNIGDWLAMPWTGTSGAPDPNNGHAVSMPGYVARGGPYDVATWGDVRARMDASFYAKYVDAPFVVLTQSIINKATQKSGNAFSGDQLLAFVAELTGATPPAPPPPTPQPPPTPTPPPSPNPNPNPSPSGCGTTAAAIVLAPFAAWGIAHAIAPHLHHLLGR